MASFAAIPMFLIIFQQINARRDCNSAYLNISITDSANPYDAVNLFAVGVCTSGLDGTGQEPDGYISQKMKCVNGEILQYVYTNSNCVGKPFKTNNDIHGYCGGIECIEYSEVKTYLNESCSGKDGWLILPMLTNDCYEYNFGNDRAQSFKFLCNQKNDIKQINLGLYNSKDCSDARYLSYEIYKDKTCIGGEYAEILTCPNNTQTTLIPTTSTNIITTGNMLKWALIGVIVIVVIGLCVAFGFNYRKKQQINQQKENLLMDSLNEKDILENENVYDLLKKWSLQQYGKVLIEEKGYDDVEIWKDLNETDLNEMGFKEGHSKKFVKMVNEYFMDVMVEADVLDKQKHNEDVITEEVVECDEENEGE